jgi:hypothetical protein
MPGDLLFNKFHKFFIQNVAIPVAAHRYKKIIVLAKINAVIATAINHVFAVYLVCVSCC